MSDIRLAKTCSTCALALFTKPKWWSYYSWRTSKRQMGICLGLCDGLPPSVTREPNVRVEFQYGKERYQKGNLKECAIKGLVVERVDYIQGVEEAWVDKFENTLIYRDTQIQKAEADWERYRYSGYASPESWKTECERRRQSWVDGREEMHVKVMAEAGAHYDSFLFNYLWWQDNWPKCRRCHRNCICDLWEEAPRREGVARSIVNGKYALDNVV